MEDILLITYHKSLSYGACLQSWASQKILTDSGRRVKFIDFENTYESRQKGLSFLLHDTPVRSAATVAKKIFYKYDKYKEVAFSQHERDLPVTKEKYSNVREMDEVEASVLVVGSDQVWNPAISGDLEEAFFLNFGKANKRVSMASSMGNHCFSTEEKERVRKWLTRFNAISVREQHALKQIQSLTDKEPSLLADPTLLIEPAIWRDYYQSWRYKDSIPNRYILAFTFTGASENQEEAFVYYSQLLQLPVVRIMLNTYKSKNVHYVASGPTPKEFISLIDNAELVITNSFHGVAFSVSMNTSFVYLPTNNSVRIDELLEKTGLTDRRAAVKGSYPIIEPLNFDRVNEVLSHERQKGIAWVRRAIG